MKKLSFKRQILERIDYFRYLDPDSLTKCATMKKDEEKETGERPEHDEEDDDKELSLVKRYSKPVDVRKYLQYVNVKSD